MVFSTWMGDLPASLDDTCASGAEEAFSELGMVDLNVVLYRADGEERDATGGDGVYVLPDAGALLYCGLQGWMPHLHHIMEKNDLGHPLCANLRAGTWTLDYVVNRLEKQTDVFPALAKPAAWFRERFDLIKQHVPPFLRPKYFAFVINVAFKAARDRAISLCAPLIRKGTSFVHQLALTSVQMYGQVKSASLDAKKTTPSLAAGLPHFTAGVSDELSFSLSSEARFSHVFVSAVGSHVGPRRLYLSPRSLPRHRPIRRGKGAHPRFLQRAQARPDP
jgi:glycogen debranching enzyme